MQNESGQNGRQARRELSIIYFIDADKTRTLRIPVSRLNFIIVALLSTTIWVVASFGIISYLSIENATLSTEVKGLMNNLFDYQARYDDVYENAYPTPIEGKKAEAPVVAAKTTSAPVVAEKKVTPKVESKSTVRPHAVPTLVEGKKIRIQNIKAVRNEGNYKYSFSLINDGNTREKGHLWGVAEIVDANGKKHLVSSPGKLDIENIGSVKNPEKGHWYAIRRFKQQSFTFDTQGIASPKVSRVIVGVYTTDKKNGIAEIQTGNNQLVPFEK